MVVYLWPSCSTDHLQDLRLAVLLEHSCHVVQRRLDDHQVGGEVHLEHHTAA